MLSPEAAISPWFREILVRPEFQKRVGLVVVDEFHLVDQWGGAFRKEYAKIRFLRGCLPSHVAWFACSATLDPFTLSEARVGANFAHNTRVIRTAVDRPEIFLRVATIPDKTLYSFHALHHIVQRAWNASTGCKMPRAIPKTVVFIDTRNGCGAAAEALKAYLYYISKGAFALNELDRMIRVYHGKTGCQTQDRIISCFQSNREARIIIATEALGLGVDLNGVKEVYRYNFPQHKHPAMLWQRAGRGARGRTVQQARFTLLVAASAMKSNPDIEGSLRKYENKALELVKRQDVGASSRAKRSCKQ